MREVIYRRPNTRKCYWRFRDKDCLKGYDCTGKCPEYLSMAQARELKREADTRKAMATVLNGSLPCVIVCQHCERETELDFDLDKVINALMGVIK